jgi:hypothetical protein
MKFPRNWKVTTMNSSVLDKPVTGDIMDGLDLASLRFLNKSAIKQHALNCAQRLRPKFTRVGQDFIDEVEADVESFVRGLRTDSMKDVAASGVLEPVDDFLTGALIEKLKPIINRQVARIIQSKVWRQTTGVTLGATR